MIVQHVMSRDVKCIEPDASIKEAATKMKAHDIGSLPVTDNGTLLGILTDRDIAIRSTANGSNPLEGKASDIMTQDLVYCYEDQTVEEAAQLMKKNKVRRLVVLDNNHHIAGICSLGDLGMEEQKLAGEVIHEVGPVH